MLVILNPSPVILNEVKNLCHWLRVNSVKNLIESIGWKTEILRLMPQNDITTQSLRGSGRVKIGRRH
ncbi:MAG TPA: hypothetical protein VJ462_06125 [Thermodesulfobacteriota bacterium]|nr:hypothetical protein [Thermodesulfobacteriota bacterium]